MASTRNQPTYDFLTGESSPPQHPLRQSLRKSTATRPGAEPKKDEAETEALTKGTDSTHEDLRAQIKTLQYDLKALEEEKEATALRHAQELRDAQNQAETEVRRAQNIEAASSNAARKLKAAQDELQREQDRVANEKADFERKLRTATAQRNKLQEDFDTAQEELASQERVLSKREKEVETRYETLQQTYDQLKQDFEGKSTALQDAKQQLAKRGDRVSELEGEILRLKTLGDISELDILRRELSDKLQLVKQLEGTSQAQLAELTSVRQQLSRYSTIEEEKLETEQKLRLEIAETEKLRQAEARVRILEDEKKAWAAYLERQAGDNEMLHFDTPEDLARAFMAERVEKASLSEQLGNVQPELTSKDERIAELEASLAQSRRESQEPKKRPSSSSGGAFDSKAKARLERQRILAVKEADYLRAQLREMTDDDKEQGKATISANDAERIQHLDEIAESYRREVEKLNAELSSIEAQNTPSTPRTGSKRSHEDDSSERLGELLRKNRQLQDSLSKLQTRNSILEKESAMQTSQLKDLQYQSKTRILELRDNPTTQASAIKQATIQALQAENETLKMQVTGRLPTMSVESSTSPRTPLVPKASLDALQLQLREKDETIKSREKSLERIRAMFRAKGFEFIEAAYSLLGWKLGIQPNGQVKVSSMYYPKKKNENGDDETPFILFDGENTTMKVSGGPKSAFADEIRGLIEFWVDAKGQIPCFLAAMTLEFYERYGAELEGIGKA